MQVQPVEQPPRVQAAAEVTSSRFLVSPLLRVSAELFPLDPRKLLLPVPCNSNAGLTSGSTSGGRIAFMDLRGIARQG